MARPAFLRNITHRALWIATLVGTVCLAVYWVVLREPSAEWRILALGLLLAVALGWWPIVAASTGAILAVAAWFFAGGEGIDRTQLAEEVLFFTALGLGWGVLLRGLLHPPGTAPVAPSAGRGAEVGKGFDPFAANRPAAGAAMTPPAAGRVLPATSATIPPMRPQGIAVAPPMVPPPSPEIAHEEPTAEFVLPGLQAPETPFAPAPPRPEHPPQRPVEPPRTLPRTPLAMPTQAPAAPAASVPLAAPLFTQEVDLGDFRAFVAAQQASAQNPATAETQALPVNRISGRSSEVRTPLNPVPPAPVLSPDSSTVQADPSTAAPDPGIRRSAAIARAETVPGTPFEAVLEWYNQFSWSPWKPDELERRYHRLGQKVGWDVLALQDLVRAWKVWQVGPKPAPSEAGHTSLWELEGFLHCELQGLLRSQGFPDLHLLSREERSEAWMAVYRETRGRVRGGSPVLRPMPEDLLALDTERLVSGRPDALVEIGGECDVIAFVTPYSPSESMAWSNVYACAQYKLAERLGVVVTHNPIVIRLPMSYWDERRQPRLHEVEDRATELRKLDASLERFHRIRSGSLQPKPQTHASVCNGCGSRHNCPSYSGNRPRLDLSNPPPLLRKFLQ